MRNNGDFSVPFFVGFPVGMILPNFWVNSVCPARFAPQNAEKGITLVPERPKPYNQSP